MAEEARKFDLVIIGAGPGGYVAAIRAAQLGLNVACIEKRDRLGGTCLNVGCIPSKALLESSELYHQTRATLSRHGVQVGDVTLDLPTMMERKAKVVADLTKGIDGLFKKNKITRILGTGRITSPNEVTVVPNDGGKEQKLDCRNILIATGSEPVPLPDVAFDGERIIDSTGALSLDSVPEHLIVIGGGVIGLELGSVWQRLGAKVTVVEMLPKLLGPLDQQISDMALRIFKRQGFTFHLGTRVTKVERKGKAVHVAAENGDGEQVQLKGDVLLVAVGRRPYSDALGAREVGVEFDDKGRVNVDEHFRTAVPSIYAIGDVVTGPMLAHKASEEGIAAVERIAGHASHVNYEAVPWIVYTWPEIAWVGKGEEELKAEGREYKVGTYPFQATPRAKTMGETDGMVKVLADKRTDRLLGVLIIGPRASEMIAEVAIAFEFGASAEDLGRSVHAHPTLAEAIKEAALGVDKQAIHI